MTTKKFLSETLLIAIVPVIGYYILSVYYAAMEESLSLPFSLGGIDFISATKLGFSVGLIILLLLWISELASRILPIKKTSEIGFRLRRMIQASLFIGLCLYVSSLQGHTNTWSSVLLPSALITFITFLIISIREILVPMIKFRKIKGMSNRILKVRNKDDYASWLKYLKSYFTPTSIGLLIIPFAIITTLIGNAGRSEVDRTVGRNYLIINSDPKRVVLINYGNKWLTAKFDDSYPGKPAYRKEYTIVDSDAMGKYSFEMRFINYMYVYND